jgi:SAM-dependent methyltransferase
LLLLLERADQPLVKMNHVLEFASGHGRFTRHLVKAIGPGRVTVSDVVADAVDFARQSFGVQGFVSHAVPEQLAWPRRYDLVFVLSLFSHLPRGSWGAGWPCCGMPWRPVGCWCFPPTAARPRAAPGWPWMARAISLRRRASRTPSTRRSTARPSPTRPSCGPG